MALGAVLFALLLVAVPETVGASGTAPYNPPANIAPSPNYLSSGPCTGTPGNYSCTNPCVTSQLTWPANAQNAACTNLVLRAVRAARAAEGVAAMVLPSNWYALTTQQQLFVVADLERVDRGYPAYLGLNAALSANAQNAAANNSDPTLATGFAVGNDAQGSPGFGGSWASDISVVSADYGWMYNDGWGGSAQMTPNLTCTSATAPGCWAHRDELLGSDPGYNDGVGLNCTTCEMGTGYADVNGAGSYVDLVELPASQPPAMTFTWASELPFFTSSTTTTVTTTATTAPAATTTTAAPATTSPPKRLNAHRSSLGLSTLVVHWASKGAKGITSAVIHTFRGARCRIATHVARVSYVASSNTQAGSVISSGRGFYAPRAVYSAFVTVINAAGHRSTNCFTLGTS
jgi:hypothetical protein